MLPQKIKESMSNNREMYLFASFLHYKNSGLSFAVSLFSTSASNSEGRRMNTLGRTIIKKNKYPGNQIQHEYLTYLNRIREAFTKCLSKAKENNAGYFNSLPDPSVKVGESSHFCS